MIYFLQGGSKRTRPSIIRANLRKWLKKVLDSRFPILVTRCEKRSKNFLKLAVFGVQVAAFLIEILLKSKLYRRIISLKCADFLALTPVYGVRGQAGIAVLGSVID